MGWVAIYGAFHLHGIHAFKTKLSGHKHCCAPNALYYQGTNIVVPLTRSIQLQIAVSLLNTSQLFLIFFHWSR